MLFGCLLFRHSRSVLISFLLAPPLGPLHFPYKECNILHPSRWNLCGGTRTAPLRSWLVPFGRPRACACATVQTAFARSGPPCLAPAVPDCPAPSLTASPVLGSLALIDSMGAQPTLALRLGLVLRPPSWPEGQSKRTTGKCATKDSVSLSHVGKACSPNFCQFFGFLFSACYLGTISFLSFPFCAPRPLPSQTRNPWPSPASCRLPAWSSRRRARSRCLHFTSTAHPLHPPSAIHRPPFSIHFPVQGLHRRSGKASLASPSGCPASTHFRVLAPAMVPIVCCLVSNVSMP